MLPCKTAETWWSDFPDAHLKGFVAAEVAVPGVDVPVKVFGVSYPRAKSDGDILNDIWAQFYPKFPMICSYPPPEVNWDASIMGCLWAAPDFKWPTMKAVFQYIAACCMPNYLKNVPSGVRALNVSPLLLNLLEKFHSADLVVRYGFYYVTAVSLYLDTAKSSILIEDAVNEAYDFSQKYFPPSPGVPKWQLMSRRQRHRIAKASGNLIIG